MLGGDRLPEPLPTGSGGQSSPSTPTPLPLPTPTSTKNHPKNPKNPRRQPEEEEETRKKRNNVFNKAQRPPETQIVKKKKVHVNYENQYKNLRKKVISPEKVVNTRKKVVYAPYLIKFVDYIINFTGTMRINSQGMNKKIRKLSAWPERGDKPERAGLLSLANARNTLSFGTIFGINLSLGNKNKYVTIETYETYKTSENKSIFPIISCYAGTKYDFAGVIIVNEEGDSAENGSLLVDGVRTT